MKVNEVFNQDHEPIFIVQYRDEDRDSPTYGEWHAIPVGMCRASHLCRKCLKTRYPREDCDFMWMSTFDENEAIEVFKSRHNDFYTLRVIRIIDGDRKIIAETIDRNPCLLSPPSSFPPVGRENNRDLKSRIRKVE